MTNNLFFTLLGQLYCDGIVCSDNSVSCTVSKVTSADLRTYSYTRACYDANGE